MQLLVTVAVTACLHPAHRTPEGGRPAVRPGMERAEVERLVGEPTFGWVRMGDPTAGAATALYRLPWLKEVGYVHDKVVRVTPPHQGPVAQRAEPVVSKVPGS